LVSRIFPLRRKCKEEISRNVFILRAGSDRAAQAAFLEDRQDQLFGCAGIGGRLEHHQLALLQVRANRLGRFLDVAQVRLAIFIEGRRHTDEDGIHFPQPLKVRGRSEVPAVDVLLDLGLLDMLDVRPPGIEHPCLFRVGIKPCHSVSGLGETQGQWEPDVSTSDDSYFQLCSLEEFRSPVTWHGVSLLLAFRKMRRQSKCVSGEPPTIAVSALSLEMRAAAPSLNNARKLLDSRQLLVANSRLERQDGRGAIREVAEPGAASA